MHETKPVNVKPPAPPAPPNRGAVVAPAAAPVKKAAPRTIADKYPNQFNHFAKDEGGRPRNAQVKPGEPAKLEVTGPRIPTLTEFLIVCAGQFGFVLNAGQAATIAAEVREYLDFAAKQPVAKPVAAPAKTPSAGAPPAPPAPPPARKP